MKKNISREAMYDLVWAKPMTHVAKDLGISDVMLGKMCKEQTNGLMIAVVGATCIAMIDSTLLLLPLQRKYLGIVNAARRAEIDAC